MLKYKRFRKTTRVLQDIIIDVLRQGKNQGSVDLTPICAHHSLTLGTFKDTFVQHIVFPEELGDWDLDAGKFYSFIWEGLQQLSVEDLDAIRIEFENSRALNLTRFAQKRQADVELMKIYLFQFCGANQIHGRAEIAPNGDYLLIPSVAIIGDFVRQLDQIIQQVMATEAIGTGKKAGGKCP